MPGCPIRIFADQFLCADPRNFSQLITSFIASESLGIPHTPLISLLYFLLFKGLSIMLKPLYYNELFILYSIFAYMTAKPYTTSLVFFFISQYVNELREKNR